MRHRREGRHHKADQLAVPAQPFMSSRPSWESNRRLRSSRVAGAGATLARIWPKLDGLPEIRRLSAWLEPKIGALPSKFVPVVDAAGYISSLHGWHGSFKKNIERVIADAHWRRADSYEQLRYHHGYRNLAEHIGGHLEQFLI